MSGNEQAPPPAKPSSSSWVKNSLKRVLSRTAARKDYDPIPISAEERAEAKRIKDLKAQRALAEWNRIDNNLKNAGF